MFDAAGNGKTNFEFGPYTPAATGEILWTVTIADGDDTDDDTEIATTNVR